eukprot:4052062-Amphidinium_carterae.1
MCAADQLDPENNDYDLVDADEYSSEPVDANAMGKGNGQGKDKGQRGARKEEDRRNKKPSSRGRTPNRSSRKPSAPRQPPGLNVSARMFRVARSRFDDVTPDNPPHPGCDLGRSVIKMTNRLKLQYIGGPVQDAGRLKRFFTCISKFKIYR